MNHIRRKIGFDIDALHDELEDGLGFIAAVFSSDM
jgi:hypothetical protein